MNTMRAFVTGGSSGIGKATARLLVESGASVAVAARGEERLARAVEELEASRVAPGQTIAGHALDVADPAAIRAAAPRVIERLGGLDLLVNNAGVARPGRVEELDDAVFEEMMRVNYFGAVHTTRAVLGHFLERGSGHVSFVSSLAGLVGVYGYTAYGASKFAVTGFAEALRQELAPRGIGVSILFPGDTDTPQLAGEAPYKPEETRALAAGVRVRSAEEVARAYLAGIARGKFHIVPGLDSKLTVLAQRCAPGFVRWFTDRVVRKARLTRAW